MLTGVTPVILTYNEEPNIDRTLQRLVWAHAIVIVDSHSSDRTCEIARRYTQARVVQRRFDSHAAQWNFAVHETGVETEWVLALDADYVLSAALVAEIAALRPSTDIAGYQACFRYCVGGRPLRGSLYPPVTILFRRGLGHYRQDGHTQRLQLRGATARLRAPVLHDDRKPLSAWLAAQDRYMRLEAEALVERRWRDLSWPGRVRKYTWLAPLLVPGYCLVVQRGLLDGRAGGYYALQRMLAEVLLRLRLWDADRP
ncbi:MAG: glycosyltransferase family 2 protein [Gammaproteobacteria bacterium]